MKEKTGSGMYLLGLTNLALKKCLQLHSSFCKWHNFIHYFVSFLHVYVFLVCVYSCLHVYGHTKLM